MVPAECQGNGIVTKHLHREISWNHFHEKFREIDFPKNDNPVFIYIFFLL